MVVLFAIGEKCEITETDRDHEKGSFVPDTENLEINFSSRVSLTPMGHKFHRMCPVQIWLPGR